MVINSGIERAKRMAHADLKGLRRVMKSFDEPLIGRYVTADRRETLYKVLAVKDGKAQLENVKSGKILKYWVGTWKLWLRPTPSDALEYERTYDLGDIVYFKADKALFGPDPFEVVAVGGTSEIQVKHPILGFTTTWFDESLVCGEKS